MYIEFNQNEEEKKKEEISVLINLQIMRKKRSTVCISNYI